jgi:hypothetical protein
MHDVPVESESTNKIKPRAVIFQVRDKELSKIKKIIVTDFPEIKICYDWFSVEFSSGIK